MSKISRDVIFLEKPPPCGMPTTSQGACKIEKTNVNDVNDINDLNDVIDLNQRKLDSGLSKISSHDLPYNSQAYSKLKS